MLLFSLIFYFCKMELIFIKMLFMLKKIQISKAHHRPPESEIPACYPVPIYIPTIPEINYWHTSKIWEPLI